MTETSRTVSDPLPAWMTLGEVAAWAAFREALPFERWHEACAYRPSREYGVPIGDGLLIAAIEARSTRTRWRPHKSPPKPEHLYRAAADVLLMEPGAKSASVIARVRADKMRMDAADAAIEEALADIREAMARGALPAIGISVRDISDGIHELRSALPTLAFAEPVVLLAQSSAIAFENRAGGYAHIRFAAADVVKLWPEKADDADDMVALRPAALVDSPATRAPKAAPRQAYSAKALGAWFMLRVATWQGDAPFPSEAKDLAAAKDYFEGPIPRGGFREIRRAKVPAEWQKRGRRSHR